MNENAINLTFTLATKAENLAEGFRLATKEVKGTPAKFPPYVVSIPESFVSADPILAAALKAGFVRTLDALTKAEAVREKFAEAKGADVQLSFSDAAFIAAATESASLERATGKKWSGEDIKTQVRALRDGFYALVADKQGCAVTAIPDAIVKKLQARLMQLELWFAQFASPNFRPSTPDEAERFIVALDQIGSAAQKLDVEAGDVFPVIQRRITAYLEAVAAMPDAEDEALF